MASPLVSRVPHCTSCVRGITSSFKFAVSLSHEQTRGKKKLAKVSTVNVKLLQNIPGYGRRGETLYNNGQSACANMFKGSIIPATAGLVRNVWFPRRMAEYMPDTKLKELGIDADTVARDPTFQSAKERRLARQAVKELEKPKSAPVEEMEEHVDLSLKIEPLTVCTFIEQHRHIQKLTAVKPDEATDVLDRLIPTVLAFYRTPSANTTPPTPKPLSPSIPASSVLSAAAVQAATRGNPSEKPEKISIYGSVSTSDIAANLKAIIAEDKAGTRVSLMRENISFVEEMDDRDRVRHLGSFQIDISLKGASRAVRRTIEVHTQG